MEHKVPERKEAYFVHLEAGVGLDPPAQIGASPRRKTMTSRRVEDESHDVAHRSSQYSEC